MTTNVGDQYRIFGDMFIILNEGADEKNSIGYRKYKRWNNSVS